MYCTHTKDSQAALDLLIEFFGKPKAFELISTVRYAYLDKTYCECCIYAFETYTK